MYILGSRFRGTAAVFALWLAASTAVAEQPPLHDKTVSGASGLLLALGSLFLAIAILSRSLRRQMRERTNALKLLLAEKQNEISERRKAEERLGHIIDSIEGIVWEADAARKQFTFVSREAERMLGYPVQQWLAEPDFWANHLHPEDRGWTSEFAQEQTAEGQNFAFEYRMIAADGRILWLKDLVSAQPNGQLGELGAPATVRGVMTNITNPKAAEEWQQRFVSLVENSTDFISMSSIDGEVFFVNPAGLAMTGIDHLSAGNPRFLWDFCGAEERERARSEILPAALQSGNWEGDSTLVDYRSGAAIAVHSNVFVVRREDTGEPFCIASVERDITGRQAAERALRESEEKYRTLMESAHDGIMVVDATSGLILELNTKFRELIGVAEEPVAGLSSCCAAHCVDLCRKAAEAGTSITADLTVARAGGTIPVEVSANVIQVGNMQMLQGFFRDITDRRKTEKDLNRLNDALMRSNEDLNQFAYAASHDLQEPLRTIVSHTELLTKRLNGSGTAEISEITTELVSSGTRMRQLIVDLLTYSRILHARESDRQSDLNAALQWTVMNLSTAIKDSGTKLTFDKLPVVRGDDSQFVQLFQNLLSNSIKYRGQASPVIHISAESTGESWVIAVRDNGIGIDPQYFTKIFGLFKRLHGREYPGTGIGLGLCKKIVERHGGRIWVESTAGKGSTFLFELPVE
jgi:PAS domain S-box-containing protein